MRNTELDVDEEDNNGNNSRYEYFKLDEEKKLGETFAFFAKRIILLFAVVYAISKYFTTY